MPSKRTSRDRPISAVLGQADVPTSLLFAFPLLLVYEVAVVFSPVGIGVDFVSRNLFALVGHDRTRYLIVHGVLAAAFVGLLVYLRSKRRFQFRRFPPMFLESAIWALALGSLIFFVMRDILHIDPRLSLGGTAENLMLSFGAGVHEELVFRLGLLAGGAALLRAGGVRHRPAMVIAFVVSSAAFSAAHHLGSLGDPFTLNVFVYRLLAGMIFGVLFYYRSLAHAVYTHALYDVYVMVLH